MGFQLKLTTPHGIVLEEAYCNIDFFSFTKRHEGIIYNMVFYRDKEAFDNGFVAIPDMMIADNVPLTRFDMTQDIREQIYLYAKDMARIACGDGDFLAEYQERVGEIITVDMQYSLLKDYIDILESV